MPLPKPAPIARPTIDDHLDAVPVSVARRLQARTDQVARQLRRSGLHTRRFDSRQVAELLHRCWSPELARVQRLREKLGAYTTLVVGSRRLAHSKRRDDASAAGIESGVSLAPMNVCSRWAPGLWPT
jgi:hypothetical protein